MKKQLFMLLAISTFTLNLNAQQKVKDGTVTGGSLANKDAMLELESSTKGLLHVRIALIESTNPSPLTAHVAGMMVYNTVTINDVVPGIYYNDGAKWIKNAKGDKGDIGAQGPIGLTGATGPQGNPGISGLNGVKGDIGAQGPIGLTGATGPQGNPGISGLNGVKGDTGAQGQIGLTGATGAQGIPGVNGSNGVKGDIGAQGQIGLTGATGAQGIPGVNGSNGIDGAKGDIGDQGPIGLTGATGTRGLQGGLGLIINGTNTTIVGTGIVGDEYRVNTPASIFAQSLSTGIITHTNESGTPVLANVISTNAGNLLAIGTDGGAILTATAINGPWNNVANNLRATTNIQDVYQMGNIGIQNNNPNSTLAVTGSVSNSIRIITANDEANNSDFTIVSRAPGAINLILPDPATCKGRIYYIINNGGDTITTSRSFEVSTGQNQNSIPRSVSGVNSPNPNFGNKFLIQSDGAAWVLLQLG